MHKLTRALIGITGALVLADSTNAAPMNVIQKINGADVSSGAVQLGNTRMLTIVGYAADVATNDTGNIASVILRNSVSGTSLFVPVVRRIASADALIASSVKAAPSSSGKLVDAGFLAVIDSYTIPAGTYEVYGVSGSFNGSSSAATVVASTNGTLVIPANRATDDIQLVAPDGSTTSLSGRAVTYAGGSTALALAGYPALRNGSYVVKATAYNKYGRAPRQDSITVQYTRPVVKADISAPLVQDFPGLPKQVVLTNALDGSLLSGSLQGKVMLQGQVLGSVSLQGQPVSASVESDVTFSPKSSGRYQVSAAATGNRGTARVWLNHPDAPDLELSIGNWDPDAGIKISKDKEAYAPLLDSVNVNVVADASAGNCFGVYGMTAASVAPGTFDQPACAVRYRTIPDGVAQEGTGRANLRGSLTADGDQTIEFDTGVLWTNPETNETKFYKAKDRSFGVTGILAKAPEVTFTPIDKLVQLTKASQGKYLTYSGQTIAGRLTVSSRYSGVTASIKVGDGQPKVVNANGTSIREFVSTSIPQIWGSQEVVVETWYNKYPDKHYTVTLPFTAIPKEPVVVIANSDTVSTADAVVRGNLGVFQGGANGFSYDPTQTGAWTVQLFEEDAKGNRTPLGSQIEISAADGGFAVNLGQLQPGRKSVVAVGTIINSVDGVSSQQVVSSKASITIKDGSALNASVTTRQNSGAVPFSPTLSITLDNVQRVSDIGSVEWYTSNDGVSFDKLPDTTLALRPELKQSGKVYYKAKLTNRFSGIAAETNPITVQAFSVPKVAVSGDTATFVGHPATLTAQSDVDADFTWYVSTSAIDKNPQVITDADSITVSPSAASDMLIKVVASEKNAPSNNPVKNASVTTVIRAVKPGVQRPMIYGPGYVETGKTYDFSAAVAPLFAPGLHSSLSLKGRWVLPDGSTQDGDKLTYTVRSGDKSLRYEAWVDGVDGVTTSAEFPLRSWTYVWPQWQMQTRVIDNRVPATLRLQVVTKNPQDIQNLGGEKLQYSWQFPASFKVFTKSDGNATVEVDEPGAFQVLATVSDSRGNVTQLASDQISIAPAPDLVPDLALQSGDRWNRAPNKIYARVNLLSVPKNDSVDVTTFKLNGTEISSGRGIAAYIDVPNAGTNEITAIVHSVGGKVGSTTKTIDLVTGDNPNCKIAQLGDAKTSLTLTAKCTVQQGTLASYKWVVNGNPMAVSSYMVTFSRQDLDAGIQSVQVTATTDKGQSSTATWPQ